MAEGFIGMAALIADLEALGPQLAREAAHIVQAVANSAAVELRSNYPVKDGALRNGVSVEDNGPLRKRVVSRARHAHLFEYGTVRRYTASVGANRGTMPAQPTLVPVAVRSRRRMVEQLVALVRRTRIRGMTGTLDVRETA